MLLRPALMLLAVAFALPVSAQIYQWKDENGRTHYSDTPPPSGPVKTLRGAAPQQHAPSAPTSAAEPAAVAPETAASAAGEPVTDPAASDPEAQFRARRAAAAEAEQQAKVEAEKNAERERFCSQARNQLRGLQSGQRIARMNAAGEREFLSDAEREEEISRLQRQLAENCQ